MTTKLIKKREPGRPPGSLTDRSNLLEALQIVNELEQILIDVEKLKNSNVEELIMILQLLRMQISTIKLRLIKEVK